MRRRNIVFQILPVEVLAIAAARITSLSSSFLLPKLQFHFLHASQDYFD